MGTYREEMVGNVKEKNPGFLAEFFGIHEQFEAVWLSPSALLC
jgi:hypothetical protein